MKDISKLDEILAQLNGKKISVEERAIYDPESLSIRLGGLLQNARKEAKMTQEELALKTGTKKSYISRIESGKIDMQISTFYKIVGLGLGKSLEIKIK
ncbi:MAG: helix-turn-helix transcriptional regulator [Saprospiraceae bacterium]|nr:helix-turn-helix transcriptional regulator [Saprospiraceae bacterium]MBK8855722.1 helix-turn-helix transcriptional regulator [Saprospiraceae bacterium]